MAKIGTGRSCLAGLGHDDPHDEIALEILGLWLGLARLRDKLRSTPADKRTAFPTGKRPSGKKLRRKAA